jgi:hypothetical protein
MYLQQVGDSFSCELSVTICQGCNTANMVHTVNIVADLEHRGKNV